jgi:hypothetical protein
MRIRDLGWKKVGSGINIPDPQHWLSVLIPVANHLLSLLISQQVNWFSLYAVFVLVSFLCTQKFEFLSLFLKSSWLVATSFCCLSRFRSVLIPPDLFNFMDPYLAFSPVLRIRV